MTESKPTVIQIFVCPTCGGHEQQADCPTCKGDRVIGVVQGVAVVFRKTFGFFQILERKLERITDTAIFLFFLSLGLLGAASLAWFAYQHQGELATAARWWTIFFERSWEMALFWTSLVGDGFLYFRWTKKMLSQERIPSVRYEGGVSSVQENTAPEEFFALSADHAPQDIYRVLTQESKEMLEKAWGLARRVRHDQVTPLHLFAVLTTMPLFQLLLARLDAQPQQFVESTAKLLHEERPSRVAVTPSLSRDVLFALMYAYDEALRARFSALDLPQLFLGVVRADKRVQDVLLDAGLTDEKLRNVMNWIALENRLRGNARSFERLARFKPKGEMNRSMTAVATPFLDLFSKDLTRIARAGRLPLVVGRDRELDEIFRVIEGGDASVILVGPSGVGKTAVVEAVAQRMVTEDVPEVLQDKRLVSLSIGALVAGATARGELEERVMRMIDEVVRAGNVVLHIDNIQNFIGTSAPSGGEGLDASEVLSEVLEKRAFQVVATATSADYRKTVEQSALGRHLQKIEIEEMDPSGAIQVLESKAPFVEYKHKVVFSYDALEKAVILSGRYLHEKYLPAKAVDLLEEVAPYVLRHHPGHPVVSGEDMAAVVSAKTRIPLTKITEGESEKLLHLEEEIHRRIVGQDEAVKAVAAALRRARTELRDAKRPIANFLFMGPTGVGKTETAKAMAAVYFGDETQMVRLDMSEFQEQSSIYRLMGAPAGYAGSSTGQLTEAVRLKPFSLVLLDELEKAHPDILNVFLQVLDDGRLTDGMGRTIDFTNTIIIATSNAGTKTIQEGLAGGVDIKTVKQTLMNDILLQYFRPEFLNRFDDIVLFKPLTKEEVRRVAELLLLGVAKQLETKGITLVATPEAVRELSEAGFDPLYGARPLRRMIQDRVDNALANFLLSGKLNRRDVAVLEAGGLIRVEKAKEL